MEYFWSKTAPTEEENNPQFSWVGFAELEAEFMISDLFKIKAND